MDGKISDRERENSMKQDVTYEKNQFTKGYAYNIYYFDEIETFPLHWHHYVEIIYAKQEGTIYEVNGEKIHMDKGDILFIWPGELHAILYMPHPNTTLMLQFDAQLLTDRIDFQKSAYLFYSTRLIGERIEEEKKLAHILQTYLLDILDITEQEEYLTEIRVCIRIYEFILGLGEGIKQKAHIQLQGLTKHKSKLEQQMLHVCNYITANCAEKITLEMAANVAGFSKFHFTRLFREYTGHGFPEFLDKERLRIAEILLKDFSLSITEVSQEAGFNSISTFNRVFLKFKKVSPTKYRRMYQI